MKGNGWKIGFAYERYGYITVGPDEAETEEEAVEVAQEKLDEMSLADMEALADYLQDSEEIDEEGVLPL